MVLQVILLDYIGCNMGFAEFLGQQAHLISISGGNGATQINAPIIEKSLLMLRRLHGRSYLGHGYIGGLKVCQFVY